MIYNVGSGAGGSAENINYNNTESGLEATNVQDAVDELNNTLMDLETYSSTETIIGKWINNKPIFRKCFDGVSYLTKNSDKIILNIPDLDVLLGVVMNLRVNGKNFATTNYNVKGINLSLTENCHVFTDANGNLVFNSPDFTGTLYGYVEYTKLTD